MPAASLRRSHIRICSFLVPCIHRPGVPAKMRSYFRADPNLIYIMSHLLQALIARDNNTLRPTAISKYVSTPSSALRPQRVDLTHTKGLRDEVHEWIRLGDSTASGPVPQTQSEEWPRARKFSQSQARHTSAVQRILRLKTNGVCWRDSTADMLGRSAERRTFPWTSCNAPDGPGTGWLGSDRIWVPRRRRLRCRGPG